MASMVRIRDSTRRRVDGGYCWTSFGWGGGRESMTVRTVRIIDSTGRRVVEGITG